MPDDRIQIDSLTPAQILCCYSMCVYAVGAACVSVCVHCVDVGVCVRVRGGGKTKSPCAIEWICSQELIILRKVLDSRETKD